MVTIGNSKPHNMALHTLTLYLSKFSICKITWNNSFFFNLIYLFIYFYIYFGLCWVFVSVRGLSLVAASGGHSSSRCAGLFTIAASLAGEHRFQTCRLSSCGSRAQLLRGMWDTPRPGLEPVSPALAGRFSTTAPPGKPLHGIILKNAVIHSYIQPSIQLQSSKSMFTSFSLI